MKTKNYIKEYKALLNELGGHHGRIASAMDMSQASISRNLQKNTAKKYQYLALLGLKSDLENKQINLNSFE